MWVKAALNGGRARREHPAIPVTPQELALEASAAVLANAQALHIHPRNSSGVEDLADRCVADALEALRNACPGIPVGVTTGLWIFSNPAARLSTVSAWSTLPDFASINIGEAGSIDLALLLSARGVALEAGLTSVSDTQLFLSLQPDITFIRALLEPPEPDAADALATVSQAEELLDQARCTIPRLLHGCDATAWPLLRAAGARGYLGRIGFEDVLHLPDGTPAPGNAALVSAALQLAPS